MARGKVTEVDWPNVRRCSRACGRLFAVLWCQVDGGKYS
jgi:hypothetical protein